MKFNKLFLLPALALALSFPGVALAAEATPPAVKAGTETKIEKNKETPVASKAMPDKRARFKEEMKKVREENAPLLDKMKVLREEIKTIVSATKFDKEAFINKSIEMDALHIQLKQKTAAAMAALFEKLSPEERKAFMARPPRHGGPQGKGRGPRGMAKGGDMMPPPEGLPPMAEPK